MIIRQQPCFRQISLPLGKQFVYLQYFAVEKQPSTDSSRMSVIMIYTSFLLNVMTPLLYKMTHSHLPPDMQDHSLRAEHITASIQLVTTRDTALMCGQRVVSVFGSSQEQALKRYY